MANASVSLYAMALAAAGLPLYIHLPRYAEVELGLSLSVVGAVLIGIRILDFVQDPALGWMVDRWPRLRSRFAWVATIGLGLGFLALFSAPPLVDAVTWLVLVLVLVFTSYSLAAILFYSQTRALAESDRAEDLVKVGTWREIGTLGGIVVAAVLPSLFGYTVFGFVLMVIVLVAGVAAAPIWRLQAERQAKLNWSRFAASGGMWLLGLALVNSLPVAITSTLFLFFVEDALQLSGMSGLYLILFFVAAGISIALWSMLARRFEARNVLVGAMTLAIFCFVWAAYLPAGASLSFAMICVASGLAAGADILLLPVLFSGVLARAGLQAGQAFGLWAFANKMALALAAAFVLPILDASGFRSDQGNSREAIETLTILYAVVPLGLKALAIGLVLLLPRKALLQ
ncbi:MFS transporter [Shimia sp. CNT1-13L.2]|uniref:MFS transporter n=1 Tax=Shimia sp. CNT1-13L.2 TaxID=2959663 RepID=UPI0020CFBD52|nr:MFS transporter [Shimia sp. CNT1-13L.2]MCP9484045.1 MFS transporter [Shimia sp. CNT1-13L.2]